LENRPKVADELNQLKAKLTVETERAHNRKFRLEKGNLSLYAFLYLFAIPTLFPLVWMFYTSFKSNREISQDIFALPTQFHFENYVDAWQTASIGVYLLNSLLVALTAIVLTILVSASAAFILAKFNFRFRKAIYSLFIIGMLIPLQSVLVPLFLQMRSFGLLNSLWSLIISYTAFGLPVSIFILESFIRVFPDSVIEAAVIDGSSLARVFFQLILPMSRPAIATVAILNFLNNWKEFSFALIFISDDLKKTLPLGLYNFLGAYTSDYAALMAALTIASLPVLGLYLILQEQVIKGMTTGAVKG
jgi:raffinose/stachyose/melibiose transport system permease protein